ncbi:MAG: sialate O-acetylesterase [Parafilimonas sp.]
MRTIILTICFFISFTLSAQLRTANIFTSHMVLQCDKSVPVWGWADKNEKVTLKFNGQSITEKANTDGKWMIQLSSMQAGGPYDMFITAKKDTVVLHDVMIGEVWICSGQSNMEFALRNAQKAKETIAAADSFPIREFKVATQVSLQPLDDITKSEWVIASPKTAGDFTAVGYFFAKELAQKLHVTVGLINDNWGGSQIEGWISKDAMLGSDELKDYAQHVPSTWEEADSILLLNLKKDLSAKNNGQLPIYDKQKLIQADASTFNTWLPYSAPGQWDWQGVWAFRGTGYFEKTINVTSDEVAQNSVLSLGDNDGKFELYINGKPIIQSEGKDAHLINLPAQIFKAGKNILLISQAKQTEPAWYGNGFYGDPSHLYLQFNDATVSLAGDGWKIFPDFDSSYNFQHAQNNAGTIIYNAMLHPIVPYAIKGVIWYQGEANASRAYQYRKTFPLMIESWRNEWKDSFPFLFVQLASFGGQQNSNEGSNWAELREAQTMTLSLPKTGMAVTTDIGNPDNIHPTDKEDVGKRLAASAFNEVYNMNVIPNGPLYKSAEFKNGKAIISFNDVGKGLMIKDKYGYLKGFEIAGADKKFYYAKAEIDGDKVIVWCDEVTQPVAVRYAWTDAPVDANLFNADDFPASSFRTDDWKGITEGKKFE